MNNIYPKHYDEKCLPWTWFLPCYVQMTLLLPIIIRIYTYIGAQRSRL